MNRPTLSLRLIIILFTVAFVAAACSSDESADETATTAAESENPDDGEDQSDGSDAAIDPSDLSDDCRAELQQFADLQASFADAATGGSADFEEAADDLQALADAAPDDISDAFQVLADELGPYFRKLGELGLDSPESLTPEKLVELGTLSETIDGEAVDQASAEVEAYYEEACGS